MSIISGSSTIYIYFISSSNAVDQIGASARTWRYPRILVCFIFRYAHICLDVIGIFGPKLNRVDIYLLNWNMLFRTCKQVSERLTTAFMSYESGAESLWSRQELYKIWQRWTQREGLSPCDSQHTGIRKWQLVTCDRVYRGVVPFVALFLQGWRSDRNQLVLYSSCTTLDYTFVSPDRFPYRKKYNTTWGYMNSRLSCLRHHYSLPSPSSTQLPSCYQTVKWLLLILTTNAVPRWTRQGMRTSKL